MDQEQARQDQSQAAASHEENLQERNVLSKQADFKARSCRLFSSLNQICFNSGFIWNRHMHLCQDVEIIYKHLQHHRQQPKVLTSEIVAVDNIQTHLRQVISQQTQTKRDLDQVRDELAARDQTLEDTRNTLAKLEEEFAMKALQLEEKHRQDLDSVKDSCQEKLEQIQANLEKKYSEELQFKEKEMGRIIKDYSDQIDKKELEMSALRQCDDQKLIKLEEQVASLRRSNKIRAGGDLAHPNNNQRLNEMRGMYEAKIVSLEEQVRKLNSALAAERKARVTSDKTDKNGKWPNNLLDSSSNLFGSRSKWGTEKSLSLNKDIRTSFRDNQVTATSACWSLWPLKNQVEENAVGSTTGGISVVDQSLVAHKKSFGRQELHTDLSTHSSRLDPSTPRPISRQQPNTPRQDHPTSREACPAPRPDPKTPTQHERLREELTTPYRSRNPEHRDDVASFWDQGEYVQGSGRKRVAENEASNVLDQNPKADDNSKQPAKSCLTVSTKDATPRRKRKNVTFAPGVKSCQSEISSEPSQKNSRLDTPRHIRSNSAKTRIEEDEFADQAQIQDATCKDRVQDSTEASTVKRPNLYDIRDFHSVGQVQAQELPGFQFPHIGSGIPSFQKLLSGHQPSSASTRPFRRAPPKE